MSTKEVMRTTAVALPGSLTIDDLRQSFATQHGKSGQWLYPIVREDQTIIGVANRAEIQKLIAEREAGKMPINLLLADTCEPGRKLVVAYPDEPLRVVVNRMAECGFTRFPVVDRRSSQRDHGSKEQRRPEGQAPLPRLVGLVSLNDLLKARVANLEAERRRERVLPIRLFLPRGFRLKA
jgi:CBS domain-containing protein